MWIKYVFVGQVSSGLYTGKIKNELASTHLNQKISVLIREV
jgi:hypothetical protein